MAAPSMSVTSSSEPLHASPVGVKATDESTTPRTPLPAAPMAEPTTGNPESRRAAPPTKQVTKPAQALGEILVERKLVTKGQLAQAMDRQKRTRRRPCCDVRL